MFLFNEEQVMIRNTVRKFVAQKIEIGAEERADKGIYPAEIIRDLGELGYRGLVIPEEYSGIGLDTVSSMVIINEIARSDASIAHLMGSANFAYAYPVYFFSTEAQKMQFLLPCIEKGKVGVLAANEPDGTGMGQVKTTAKRDGDYYILNGTKTMITDAHIADYGIVYTKTGDNAKSFFGNTAFLVNLKDTPGVTIGKEERTMGLSSLKLAEIHFNNVRIHYSSILGKEGEGILVIGKALELMKLSNSAVALGLAERAYEESLYYTRIRNVNSQRMCRLDTIRFEMAEMKAKLVWLNLAIYYTAQLFDAKPPDILTHLAITKYNATETAKEICDRALQLFGGYGYIRGYTVERLYRDIRAFTIIGGSSEVQKWAIANDIYKTEEQLVF